MAFQTSQSALASGEGGTDGIGSSTLTPRELLRQLVYEEGERTNLLPPTIVRVLGAIDTPEGPAPAVAHIVGGVLAVPRGAPYLEPVQKLLAQRQLDAQAPLPLPPGFIPERSTLEAAITELTVASEVRENADEGERDRLLPLPSRQRRFVIWTASTPAHEIEQLLETQEGAEEANTPQAVAERLVLEQTEGEDGFRHTKEIYIVKDVDTDDRWGFRAKVRKRWTVLLEQVELAW